VHLSQRIRHGGATDVCSERELAAPRCASDHARAARNQRAKAVGTDHDARPESQYAAVGSRDDVRRRSGLDRGDGGAGTHLGTRGACRLEQDVIQLLSRQREGAGDAWVRTSHVPEEGGERAAVRRDDTPAIQSCRASSLDGTGQAEPIQNTRGLCAQTVAARLGARECGAVQKQDAHTLTRQLERKRGAGRTCSDNGDIRVCQRAVRVQLDLPLRLLRLTLAAA